MRLYVLKSLALVLVAASCSSGVGPTNTKTVDPLRYTVAPAASAVGYDTSVVSWSVGPRPAKGEVTCPGMVVSSGALAMSHTVVLKELPLGANISCQVSSWEDGSSPIVSSVSFQTRVEPCVDPTPPVAKLELLYTFPMNVPVEYRYVVTYGYKCDSSTRWNGEGMAAAPTQGGSIHPNWDVAVNQPYGHADHVVCVLRGDGYPLKGSEFALHVVGSPDSPVHLTRSIRRKRFDTQPEMDCWMFRLSAGTVYP